MTEMSEAKIPEDLQRDYEIAKSCSVSTGFLGPLGTAFVRYIERIAALTTERDEALRALKMMRDDSAFEDLCQGIGEEPNWLKQARALLRR